MYNTVWQARDDVVHRLRTMTSHNDLFIEPYGILWNFTFEEKFWNFTELYNGYDGTELSAVLRQFWQAYR